MDLIILLGIEMDYITTANKTVELASAMLNTDFFFFLLKKKTKKQHDQMQDILNITTQI